MESIGFGIVISLHAKRCEVVSDEDGQEITCLLRGKLFDKLKGETKPIAVGDRVRFRITEDGAVLDRILPRRNALTRPAVGRRTELQTIAANIDSMIVVASLKTPPLRCGLIDRFLVAASIEDFDAHICLNKIDLLDPDEEEELLNRTRTIYTELGYRVLATSALDGRGVDAFQELLKQGVSLIVGHSGVGKSTLINRVDPKLKLKTGLISPKKGKGKHTTTRVSLLRIEGQGYVVDTPGIREFAIQDIRPADLGHHYPELAALIPSCQFPNCTHLHEPGCAVLSALEEGKIHRSRYNSYLKILKEIPR